MLHLMTSFFNAGFYFPGYNWTSILLAIAIGVVFGGIWLFLYRPPLFKTARLWYVFFIGAILTWAAVSFIQLPCRSGQKTPWCTGGTRKPWAPPGLYYSVTSPSCSLPVSCRKPPKSPPFSSSGSAVKVILRPNSAWLPVRSPGRASESSRQSGN